MTVYPPPHSFMVFFSLEFQNSDMVLSEIKVCCYLILNSDEKSISVKIDLIQKSNLLYCGAISVIKKKFFFFI